MKRPARSREDLQRMALDQIRKHPGCNDVREVAVHPVIDERADCNWSIAVTDLGQADAYHARRIALAVHDILSAQYDLILKSASDAEPGTWRLRG